ncbi:hypothetical protein J7J64_08625, partial [Lysobacter sp. ISL-42]
PLAGEGRGEGARNLSAMTASSRLNALALTLALSRKRERERLRKPLSCRAIDVYRRHDTRISSQSLKQCRFCAHTPAFVATPPPKVIGRSRRFML